MAKRKRKATEPRTPGRKRGRPKSKSSSSKRVIKITNFSPPAALDEAAFRGRIGEFVKAVSEHTEATDAGVLAHLLPIVGVLAGGGVHVWAGGKQPARINAVVVGPTNCGRKGTACVPVDLLMKNVCPKWWGSQRTDGLSSGEGLIVKVADEKDDDGGTIYTEKRLQVIEEEFSRILVQIQRKDNILSQLIRSAFDTGDLRTLTVEPREANNAHISVVGHITPEELEERLNHIEMANGFGNRFLWFHVYSDKFLPNTEPIPGAVFKQFAKWIKGLKNVGAAAVDRRVPLSTSAQKLWEDIYLDLRRDKPEIAGAMQARGSSFVLRLALIYALARHPKPKQIQSDDLHSALAVWKYSAASVDYLFQSVTGDKFADKLLTLLDQGPMTKTDFNKHLSVRQKNLLSKTLEKLENDGFVETTVRRREGAGRPAHVYKLRDKSRS